MTKAIFVTITTLVITISMAFTTLEKDIIGNWKAVEMENSTIKVYKAKDGNIYGKIIESNRKDWIGEIILKKVKYIADDKEWKGELYSLQRKMSVDVTITLLSQNKLKLVGKKFFMTKTFYWER